MMWLVFSSDPSRERVMAAVLRDSTEFSTGFSQGRFDTVRRGQTENDVRDRLGAPFNEFLFYDAGGDGCSQIRVDGDIVGFASPPEACQRRGIRPTVARKIVLETLGAPDSTCWVYSRSRTDGFFRARGVCFIDGRVDETISRWIRE